MGVNTCIMLPPDVKLGDVATVVGGCAGVPKTRKALGGSYRDSWYVHMPYMKVESAEHLPACARFEWSKGCWLKENGYSLYHFEPDNSAGRLMLPPSTAWWIATAVRLVDFFGGHVDFSDCDDVDVDHFAVPHPNRRASDGEPWQELQQRMWDVTPVTREEAIDNEILAAYGYNVEKPKTDGRVFPHEGELFCVDCWVDENDHEPTEEEMARIVDVGEADSPQHCARAGGCLNPIRMTNGTAVGAWLGNALTDDGQAYIDQQVHYNESELAWAWHDWYRNASE